MKALTLFQPYAAAVAAGSKLWLGLKVPTAYRGPLAIHAAAHRDLRGLMGLHGDPAWIGALNPVGWTPDGDAEAEARALPVGAIVALAELVEVLPTVRASLRELHALRFPDPHSAAWGRRRDPHAYGWTEDALGDYAPGRWAWKLARVRPLPASIPCPGGAADLFDLGPDARAEILAQTQQELAA